MSFRVSDANSGQVSSDRINSQRARLNVLQERLATGKRINKPSDDPHGAEAVINIRTTQNEIEQFQRNASQVNHRLTTADDALGTFELTLERVKTLVSQGLSGTQTTSGREAIALELESLRGRILETANLRHDGKYLFGGTRQNEAPFDPTTALPSATPATARYVQIEPGANAIPTGVTAETFLSDSTSNIFTDLDAAITALRGTGDDTADRATLTNTFTRLGLYSELTSTARSKVGANVNLTELVAERLSSDFLSLNNRASNIEDADFADTVVRLTQAQQALEATLQVTANGKRSLFDFLR